MKQAAWAAYRARMIEEEATLAQEVANLIAAKKKRLEEIDEEILDGNW